MAKEYRIYMDGNAWCAVADGFINLQESDAGFGASPMEALGELVVLEAKKELERCRTQMRDWICNNCGKRFSRRIFTTPPCGWCKAGGQYVVEVRQ